MKVVEITGEPILHGGQERFLLNLIANKEDDDITIDVITPHFCDNTNFIEVVEGQGGRVYELSLEFSPGNSRKLLLAPVSTFLKERRYDVAHIHSGSTSALAYISQAASLAGVKKIIVHSHSAGMPTIKRRLIRAIFGYRIKRYATDFLACGYEAGEIKYPSDIVRDKMIVIPNGVKIEDYQRNNDVRSRVREELGISEGAKVIGHIGRFSTEKNHTELIDIFEKCHKDSPKSILLLVGNGDLFEEIKNKVVNKGLMQSVIFTGNVDNAQAYYQAMDVFVLPSLWEGLPFVGIEAQAAGLPCIFSTNVPEKIEITDGVRRIDLEDIDKWVEEIKSAEKREIKDNSEALRKAGYDIKNTVKQIESIYRSAF